MASAMARLCSGRNVPATPSACGKIVASRAMNPEQISSCTMAGMPRRVWSTRCCWISLASAAAAAARETARPADPRDVADPVAQDRLGALRVEAVRPRDLEDPGAAELGELLVERHECEQVGDAVVDRRRGVEIRRGRVGGGHRISWGLEEGGWTRVVSRSWRCADHSLTAPAVSPPMICRSAIA